MRKNKLLLILPVTVIFIIFFSFKPAAYASGGMNGYMTNLLSDIQSLSPTAYQGQQRGFFVGGSMEIPPQGTTIQPFSATLPHMSLSGCGGIDLTMGGFSYLNFKYLVQKLQGILQAAPAFAFEIGLKVLSEQAGGVINDLEAATNAINDLNLNSCKSMDNIVNTVSGGINSAINNLKAKQTTANSQASGGSSWFGSALSGVVSNVQNSWQGYVNEVSQQDQQDQQSGVNPLINFGLPTQTPSLLDVASQDVSTAFPNFIPIMRYYVGDVVPVKPAKETTGKVVSATTHYQPPCHPNFKNLSQISADIVKGGTIYEATIKPNTTDPANFCSNATKELTFTPLENRVESDLNSILTAVQTDSEVSQQDISLINMSPIPILPFLRVVALTNNPGVATVLIDPLAKTVAYGITYQLIDNLAGLVGQGVSDAKLSLEGGTLTASPTITSSRKLEKNINVFAEAAYKQYAQHLAKVENLYGNFMRMYHMYKNIINDTIASDQNIASAYKFEQVAAQRY